MRAATAGLGGATFGLTRWSSSGALDTAAGVSIAAGFVLLGAFLAVEKHRGDKAMMPLAIFTGRCFFGLNLMTFLLYGAFAAAIFRR